jgi:LmbE family N-acetylglucosaminyl deacetylase
MHIQDLRQVHDEYEHVFLSPHLDDAALSCGGIIARHSAAGSRILVVTVCSGIPPVNSEFSQFAQDTHKLWKLPPDQAVTARIQEDKIAMQHLGADNLLAGLADAIYRCPDHYISNETLFGKPWINDPLYQQLKHFLVTLRNRLPNANFYAPLAIGYHVDHQITQSVAQQVFGTQLAYYEDIPYVLKEQALEQRLADIGPSLIHSTIGIDGSLSRKIGSIAAYTSQIDSLFGGLEQMEKAITDYAESLVPENETYGERIWLLNTQEAN